MTEAVANSQVAELAARPLARPVTARRCVGPVSWLPDPTLPENWPDVEQSSDLPLQEYEAMFARVMADRYGDDWQRQDWTEEDCLAELVLQERLSALQDQLDEANRRALRAAQHLTLV